MLPVELRRPARAAARAIRAATRAIKASDQIAGSEMVLRSLGQLPVALRARAARLAASPRLFNLTVSNVPGPPVALYVAGARVSSVFPVIPLADGHALSFGALSYDGSMQFAAYADPAVLPEADRLPDAPGRGAASTWSMRRAAGASRPPAIAVPRPARRQSARGDRQG